MLEEMWMLDYLVEHNAPMKVTNPDGTTFELVGFLPVFEKESTAKAFSISVQSDNAPRKITPVSKVSPIE